jgi:hypothetical protein
VEVEVDVEWMDVEKMKDEGFGGREQP